MSDFEDLLSATTPEEMNAKLGRYTRHILRKWRTEGLTEGEARQLLQVWCQVNAPTHTIRQDRLSAKLEVNGNPHCLLQAARHYGKDPKTIRRWCKKGYFPGAYQTKGKHWRIPFLAADKAVLPVGFARKPKTIFGTKVWKEFKAEAPRIFGPELALLYETEAARQDMSEAEFALARKTKDARLAPSEAAFDVLEKAVRREKVNGKGETPALAHARLVELARRLYLNAPDTTLSHKHLSKAMGISTATLYRRFTAKGIREVLDAANERLPLGNQDDRPDVGGTLHDQVAEHFIKEAEQKDTGRRPIPSNDP